MASGSCWSSKIKYSINFQWRKSDCQRVRVGDIVCFFWWSEKFESGVQEEKVEKGVILQA